MARVHGCLDVGAAGVRANTLWHKLKVSMYGGFNAPNVTTARIDSCLTTATNIIVQDSDGSATDDVGCNTQLLRDGNVGSFLVSDGNVDTNVELNNVFNALGFLKLVKTITFCGDAIGSFAGCTPQNAHNNMVFSEGAMNSTACGKYLAHEFGHSVGFGHTTYNKNVMKQGEDASLTHLFASQCPYYRIDCMDYDGPGGTAPKNGCTTPSPLPGAADTLDLTGVPIAALARLGLGDRVPVEAMDRYTQADAPELIAIIADAAQAKYHPGALRLLGLVGDAGDDNAQQLIKYIESGSTDAAALSTATLSLGYLANRGNASAWKYLVKRADDVSSPIADWSVSALALSGKEETLTKLKQIQGDVDGAKVVNKRHGRAPELVAQAMTEHQKVRSGGLRAYYKRK